ncbi:MAG: transcriptional regulator [Promethearchaeota archaeon]
MIENNDIPLFSDIDKLIHEPARLLIMSFLYVVKNCDFQFLMVQTSLTKGNLSSHLSKLEDAKYIFIEKKFKGKKPYTIISLTDDGRKAYALYRKDMDKLFSKFQE